MGNIGCSKKSTKNELVNRSWDKQSDSVTFGLSQVEQIELQAKLLNYFLRSNKSNINQFVTHERKKERKKDSERKKKLPSSRSRRWYNHK